MSLAHALQVNHLRCLLSSCLLQIKYACAMIETGTRHAILICACTNPEEVAGILRTFHLSLLISNVKHVLLHLARAPIVQVNAYRTGAITQSVSRNPRSFEPQPQHARPSSALDVPRAKGGFPISLVRLHAWPVRVSQRRREGSLRRPRGLS